jgi:hypothetical protein
VTSGAATLHARPGEAAGHLDVVGVLTATARRDELRRRSGS